MITIKAVNGGFAMYGSTEDTIEYVRNVDVGRMVEGIRLLSANECTETLLTDVESRYDVLVWV